MADKTAVIKKLEVMVNESGYPDDILATYELISDAGVPHFVVLDTSGAITGEDVLDAFETATSETL